MMNDDEIKKYIDAFSKRFWVSSYFELEENSKKLIENGEEILPYIVKDLKNSDENIHLWLIVISGLKLNLKFETKNPGRMKLIRFELLEYIENYIRLKKLKYIFNE